MVYQTIYIDKNLLKKIDEEVKKIGYKVSRSSWIVKACEEKIEQQHNTANDILEKLKAWYRSFPKKPFKELLKELEGVYNGKI